MVNPQRSTTVVSQAVGDGLAVFDHAQQESYVLNTTSALVFQHCDGQTPPAQLTEFLSQKFNIPHSQAEQLMWLALDELGKANLLQHKDATTHPPQLTLTRRQVLTALATVGLSLALTPIVSAVVTQVGSAQFSDWSFYIISGLDLTTDPTHPWPPNPGDKLVGRFTAANYSGQTVRLEGYGVRMRRNGTDYWDFLYPGPARDVPANDIVTFDQNNERPLEVGHYRAEITWKIASQDWEVCCAIEFDVGNAENTYSISGRVTDDRGEPIPDVFVTAYRDITIASASSASTTSGRMTDDRGESLPDVTISDESFYIISGLDLTTNPTHPWPPNPGDKLVGRFSLLNWPDQTLQLEGYGVRMRRNGSEYWDFLYPGPARVVQPNETVVFDQNNERPLEVGHYRAEITWKIAGQDWEVCCAIEFDVGSGGNIYSTTTDANGNYTLTDLPSGTYTVTPSKSGYTFSQSTFQTFTVPLDASSSS